MTKTLTLGDKERKRKKGLLAVFFVWPLLSAIMAFRDFGNRTSRKTIIAFFSFFGFTMGFAREGMDGYTHARKFEAFIKMDAGQFKLIIMNFILRRNNAEELDIYTTIINFLVSRFTHSYHWVFLLHALIFSVFSVKFFGFVYDEFAGKMNKNSRIFFILAFFIMPVTIVHGIRFPVAAWIYVFGVYRYLSTEKKTYIWYCALACFVHFSFALALGLILIYVALGNRNYIYLGLIALSLLAPNLMYTYLSSFDTSNIGDNLQDKLEAYSNKDYIVNRNESLESRNWYARLRIPIMQYTMIAVVLFIGFFRKHYYNQDKIQQNLFSFMLLLLAFVNFGFAFDSLGRRFLLIWILLAAIYLYRFYQQNNFAYFKSYTVILAFPTLLWIFVQTRVALDVVTPMWFIGNPVTSLFIEMDVFSK